MSGVRVNCSELLLFPRLQCVDALGIPLPIAVCLWKGGECQRLGDSVQVLVGFSLGAGEDKPGFHSKTMSCLYGLKCQAGVRRPRVLVFV